ncbi:16S rRNA (adenine(1518)-N(6)/adenine(1519)-N(6))-dimethyltransferase RsmA [Sulfurihydrogenibium sp.]|uniref:16S rRNA (adenine(1518)-N(6)/adenine(1519)-N(6))- dimethyltransferase RsmA n=1 Tax=Sulfurihydrogenibium sp. TaxID=2053621 RepID=UPI0026211388|nr:16S rRNA (adenine(1518)-N(6)/adenine(1519)-N(6))-dimethyltransferase RsmA [Sulfurihydrogenibium sp.]
MNKVKAKKQFGQHFLVSENVVKKIVDEIKIKEDDIIVEIGPGTGILTQEILNRKPQKLYSIEIDQSLYSLLEEKFNNYPNFNLIKEDALKVNIKNLAKGKKVKIVGNLPYNVASLIIINCAFNLDNIEFCVFMVQKEVAEKLKASPKSKDYTFLSVFIQTFFDVDYIMSVPARFFSPPPKVTSAVVKLTPNNKYHLTDIKKYKNFVSYLFGNRRKMLRTKVDEKILERANIKPTLRAEELKVEDFVRLFEVVKDDDRQFVDGNSHT